MKPLVGMAASAAILWCASNPALALAEKDQYSAECRRYALEDQVPQEELKLYVEQCVEDLSAADAEAARDGQTSDGPIPRD
jgi:hypothetical protein